MWIPDIKKPEEGPCGHYYPEVIRARDYSSQGRYFRVFDCIKCGRYEREVSKKICSRKRNSNKEIEETRKKGLEKKTF